MTVDTVSGEEGRKSYLVLFEVFQSPESRKSQISKIDFYLFIRKVYRGCNQVL